MFDNENVNLKGDEIFLNLTMCEYSLEYLNSKLERYIKENNIKMVAVCNQQKERIKKLQLKLQGAADAINFHQLSKEEQEEILKANRRNDNE